MILKRRFGAAVLAAWLALALVGVPLPGRVAAAPATDLAAETWTGVWRGNDGGVYYMREDASGGLMWLGVSGDGGKSWSNLYNGIIGGPGRTISTGPWVDVPIGANRGQGELGLTRKDANTIIAHRRSGGFGGSEWTRLPSDPLGTLHSGTRGAPAGEPMTGIWSGNDGGTYFVRDFMGSSGHATLRQIVWAGFSGGDSGRSWSNVFFGAFDPYDPGIITGEWADVPRGASRGGGTLRLQVTGTGEFIATNHEGFGGSRWRKSLALRKIGLPSAEEKQLFDLINDARAHPEKYPPHGNAQGAAMNSCPNLFKYSSQLRSIARAHNNFLKDQPIDWVNTYPNMHRGAYPNGKLVAEAGEPMDRAGYHSWRGENVATGFPTPADVIRFWMQDDELSKWGHRNLILNCAYQEAGVGHYQGGPGNHYWTLDVGTK